VNKRRVWITITMCTVMLTLLQSVSSQSNLLASPISQDVYSLIAFSSDRAENMDIYVMHADGSNLTRLTVNDVSDMSPRWISKTGMITFSAWREVHEQQILPYTMKVDGSDQQLLPQFTAFIERGTPDVSQIVPSPDGSQFAFVSEAQRGNNEIYTMRVSDTQFLRITTNEANDWSPAWSPDSKSIAFASDRGGNDDIYVMDVDGPNVSKLTEDKADDFAPSWSPDGEHIAFVSNRDGNPEIYVMDADGSNPINLTKDEADDFAPSWSPDGEQIVFQTNRDGNPEIYVMDADGSNPINLTNDPSDDVLPDWSPWLTESVIQQLETTN
jgi:Tol biopolymer transport system component